MVALMNCRIAVLSGCTETRLRIDGDGQLTGESLMTSESSEENPSKFLETGGGATGVTRFFGGLPLRGPVDITGGFAGIAGTFGFFCGGEIMISGSKGPGDAFCFLTVVNPSSFSAFSWLKYINATGFI